MHSPIISLVLRVKLNRTRLCLPGYHSGRIIPVCTERFVRVGWAYYSRLKASTVARCLPGEATTGPRSSTTPSTGGRAVWGPAERFLNEWAFLWAPLRRLSVGGGPFLEECSRFSLLWF